MTSWQTRSSGERFGGRRSAQASCARGHEAGGCCKTAQVRTLASWSVSPWRIENAIISARFRCDPVTKTYRDRLGGNCMRISFDTQEDTYEDALAVLRRAYGRRGPAPKQEESRAGAQVGSARGEVSPPPVKQTRSTSESATGKARPGRGTATRSGARKVAPPKVASSKVARVEKAAATSATAKRPGTKGAVTRKAARRRAPSESVAERPRRVTRKKTSAGPAANVAPPGQSEAVRAWARAQGMPVSDRGRMPASVIAAYEAAHGG